MQFWKNIIIIQRISIFQSLSPIHFELCPVGKYWVYVKVTDKNYTKKKFKKSDKIQQKVLTSSQYLTRHFSVKIKKNRYFFITSY